MTNIIGPFQVTQGEIDRSSTMTQRDLNKWALFICGTYQFFDSRIEAEKCKQRCEE